MTIRELDALHHYRTDKLSHGDTPHHYDDAYEWHFAKFQNESIIFWEIGVGNGSSLQLWCDYFPKATVIGIDVAAPTLDIRRAKFQRIHAKDWQKLGELAKEYPPDIVLDDGSHLASDIGASFAALWPLVKRLYVVEDVDTQYFEKYGNEYLDALPFTEKASHASRLLASNRYKGECVRICWECQQLFFYKGTT